jgi:hypothetical protein
VKGLVCREGDLKLVRPCLARQPSHERQRRGGGEQRGTLHDEGSVGAGRNL